jgi:hypothetical protein
MGRDACSEPLVALKVVLHAASETTSDGVVVIEISFAIVSPTAAKRS